MKLNTEHHQQARCYFSPYKLYVDLVQTAAEVVVFGHTQV
jgi:hypothetical protein